jgi:hypothetical protein
VRQNRVLRERSRNIRLKTQVVSSVSDPDPGDSRSVLPGWKRSVEGTTTLLNRGFLIMSQAARYRASRPTPATRNGVEPSVRSPASTA